MGAATTLQDLAAGVATAVDLDEGPGGVLSVLRAVVALEAPSVREISRRTSLPVPIVAAILGEMQGRGVLVRGKPIRLTAYGHSLATVFGSSRLFDSICRTCTGRVVQVPAQLRHLADRIDAYHRDLPKPDYELDQSRCTPETALRRALYVLTSPISGLSTLMFLGDDDLISLAVALVQRETEQALFERVIVVDVDEALLAFVEAELSKLEVKAEIVCHDIRDPLPASTTSTADAVITDPPYTVEGARLFVSRATSALRPEAGGQLFLSLGAKAPAATLQVQRDLTAMGFVTYRMIPNFNDYVGSSVLGGTSNLYHLTSATTLDPLVRGRYDGPLYTADFHGRARRYLCVQCRATVLVGRDEPLRSVADLKGRGCPECGGTKFRPLTLVPEGPPDTRS